MQTRFLFPFALLLLSLLAMPGQAAPGPAAGYCQHYYHSSVAAVALTVAVGDNELWTSDPGCGIARSNTQVLEYTATFSGPIILSAVAVVQTNLVGDTLVGCSISGFTNHAFQLAAGTGSTAYGRITMSSNECHGAIEFKATLTVAAVIVYQWDVYDPINIRVEQTVFTNNNNNANFDFLCAAPEIVANSYNPATVVCQEPQINNLNYLCAATGAVPDVFSETTTTCNTPTVNAALSGTINAILSGTVALTGTLTISDDSGGWIIHQDPLSGTLTIHQDPICTAAAHCHVDTNGNTTLIGNATSTTTLNIPPGFWELFGPILIAVAFAGLISWLGIWVIPGGAAIGMAIFLHAFKQPYPFLVLLQACAGIVLAIFCLIVLALKLKDLSRGKKREARRFFE